MQQQEQQSEPFRLSQQQQLAIGEFAMFLPALTLMVFIRRGIGARLLKRNYILGTSAVLYLFAVLSRDQNPQHPHALEYFALTVPVFGFAQKFKRWLEFRRGTQPYSYSVGTSIISTKRSPRFLREHWRINRFVDPLAAITFGLIIANAGIVTFGLWLVFAGTMLGLYEFFIYQHVNTRDLDLADSLIAADVQAEAARHFRRNDRSATSNSVSAAIPTGLASDIRKRILKPKSSSQRNIS